MWAVATPSRALSPNMQQPRRAPRPLGGDNGTIALPSRLAALMGRGVPAAPGPRRPTDGALGAVRLHGQPVLDLTQWPANKRLATPTGAAVTRYVRRWVEGCWAILHYAAPMNGTTGWTMNRVYDVGSPASPIPVSRRRVTETYRQMFDTRIQADYLPVAQIQRTQVVRNTQKGSGAIMVQPYFPRLTVLAATTSYGQQTQVLMPSRSGLSRFSVGV